MELLRAGWTLARRRPGLSVAVFVGDALAGVASLAALVALVFFVTLALAAGSGLGAAAGAGAAPPVWLGQPRFWVGCAGLWLLWVLGSFTLQALVRGGLLASLGHMLRSGERFRLGTYVGGGLALLDRSLPLLLLLRAAPLVGMVFVVPGLVAVGRRALLHPHFVGPHLPSAALLAAGLAGGVLVGGLLTGWAQLGLTELGLDPDGGLRQALGRAAHVSLSNLGPLLRLAAAVVLVWTGAWIAHVLGLTALTGLAGQEALAALVSLLQSGLDLLFAALAALLLVVCQAATLRLYGALAGRTPAHAEALVDSAQPDPAGARAPQLERLRAAMAPRAGLAAAAGAAAGPADEVARGEAEAEPSEQEEAALVAEPADVNVFQLADLLASPGSAPDGGLPPAPSDGPGDSR